VGSQCEAKKRAFVSDGSMDVGKKKNLDKKKFSIKKNSKLKG
jgi:hypothetical protein